jgi:NADH dehydrogenase (ubiquinone) Fe-S protein 6
MLSSARTRLAALAARATSPSLLRPLSITPFLSNQGPGTGENFNQANDPLPRKETPNVSATNETAVDAYGAQDKALQEAQLDAERQRQLQAPNRAGIWSRNQQERSIAMTGPRFEQTIMDTQVGQDRINHKSVFNMHTATTLRSNRFDPQAARQMGQHQVGRL